MHSDCTTELLRIIKILCITAQAEARPVIKLLRQVKAQRKDWSMAAQILNSVSVVSQHVVPGRPGFLPEQGSVCSTIPFATFS